MSETPEKPPRLIEASPDLESTDALQQQPKESQQRVKELEVE